MHVEVLGYGPVDLFQETDEFLGAVAWQTLADDLAGLDFLRRLAISDEPLQCRPVTGPDVQHASMFRMPPFNLICRPLGIL